VQVALRVPLTQLIAPSFYELHHELKAELYDEYWLKGGRGSTKSTFVSVQILLGMLRDSQANAVVFRRYQNELRDSVFGQFEWTAAKMGIAPLLRFQVSPMQIVFPTGQKIIFRGADKPTKLKSINLGRGYIKYAWFEELDQFGGMEEVRVIEQSLFRGEGAPRRISFYSFNPPRSGRSWVNQEVRRAKPGRRVHHSTYLDVPREWLGERFLADAEHLRQTNETAYRHEYLGEEVGTGLEVFTNLEIRRISDEEIARFDRIRQGLDFGFGAHPLAFERLHYNPNQRRLYFIDEKAGINIFNRELFNWARARGYHTTMTVADSEEPKSIAELQGLGMNVKGARKGPGSVDFGIQWLQDLAAIVIDPSRCPLAAKEFENYCLEVGRDGQVKPGFPDRDNHSIDATRYALEDDMERGRVLRTGTIELANW